MSRKRGDQFWKRVLTVLKSKQLTQADLCRATGMKTGAISSAIKRGSIPVADNAKKIADALDSSVDFLLTGKERNGEFSDDPELLEAFRAIKKSQTNSRIAYCLPFLNLEQQQLILHMIKAMDNTIMKTEIYKKQAN